MSTDRWVMVRDYDNQDWKPRILLRVLESCVPFRYLCLWRYVSIPWRQMRPATAIELLPMLPGEWAARAMLRVKQCPVRPENEASTLFDAIDYSFDWGQTVEGHSSWDSLHDALRDGTAIPDCPPLDAPAPKSESFTAVRCTCGRIVRVSFEEAAR